MGVWQGIELGKGVSEKPFRIWRFGKTTGGGNLQTLIPFEIFYQRFLREPAILI